MRSSAQALTASSLYTVDEVSSTWWMRSSAQAVSGLIIIKVVSSTEVIDIIAGLTTARGEITNSHTSYSSVWHMTTQTNFGNYTWSSPSPTSLATISHHIKCGKGSQR